jgi:hypothetical protein
MTEAEILEQLATHGDRMWSILQYWTSVSFAILIAGHFTADRIHWLVLAFFGILYACFSLLFTNMVQFDSSVITAGLDHLQQMAEEGQQLSLIGQTFISESPLSKQNPSLVTSSAMRLAFIGLFLATLVYPTYCHLKSKNSPS